MQVKMKLLWHQMVERGDIVFRVCSSRLRERFGLPEGESHQPYDVKDMSVFDKKIGQLTLRETVDVLICMLTHDGHILCTPMVNQPVIESRSTMLQVDSIPPTLYAPSCGV